MATKNRIRCNQCEALMINGLFCHETGCPNTRSRYDADSETWVKQRKCSDCGYMVDADDPCCTDFVFDDAGDNQDEREDAERADEQGSALTPVVAILTVFSVGAVLIVQSGLVNALVARFAVIQ